MCVKCVKHQDQSGAKPRTPVPSRIASHDTSTRCQADGLSNLLMLDRKKHSSPCMIAARYKQVPREPPACPALGALLTLRVSGSGCSRLYAGLKGGRWTGKARLQKMPSIQSTLDTTSGDTAVRAVGQALQRVSTYAVRTGPVP